VSAAERETTLPRAPTQESNRHLRRLSSWVTKAGGKLSVTVEQLSDKRVVETLEGEIPRNPASTTKLLTARVALGTLGLGFQFTTTVSGHAPRLVLRSDGDPTLSLNGLRGIVAELKTLGLTAVDEAIVVDQSAFDERFVPPAFEQQPEEWAAFRAPVCATALEHNRLTLRVTPGKAGEKATVFVEPPGYATVTGTIDTTTGSDTGHIGFTLSKLEDRVLLRVSGRIGEHSPQYVANRRVDDPRRVIGLAFRELLREVGVRVKEQVQLSTPADAKLPVLVTVKSEPLPVILRELGKDSDNFTAEMLLLAIALKATGKGDSLTGAKVAMDFLASLGPLEQGTVLINGSGLFDANRMSTNALLRVLSEGYRNPMIHPEYVSQLSLGELDGTLRRRFKGLPAGCQVRGKTGTLRATNALAGYVERAQGGPLVFAIIVEGVTDSVALKPEMDAYVTSLCM
jgi:serine-type D-Ala-D-Ala carboxypeptidase/endopeptidase (penicillin-binding protein 4)